MTMPREYATYDIAEETGGSAATVSRVINNSPKVDLETESGHVLEENAARSVLLICRPVEPVSLSTDSLGAARKAVISSGHDSHPANFALAGGNRSGGGNECAEGLQCRGLPLDSLASRQAGTRVHVEGYASR